MTETGLHVLYLYTYEIRLQFTIIVIPNDSKLLSHFIGIIFRRSMWADLQLKNKHTTCDDVNIGLWQAHSWGRWGSAPQQEIKLKSCLTKPKFFLPILIIFTEASNDI